MTTTTEAIVTQKTDPQGRWQRVTRNRILLVGGILFIVFVLVAIFGPMLDPISPLAVNPSGRYLAPSAAHPFGTDSFGRDILSRVISGARISLIIGICVTVLAGAAGSLIGFLAAFNRWFETISMRVMDGLMAFPGILFAIAITAAFGRNLWTVIFSLAIVMTPFISRIVRSAALRVREMPFVEALRSQGARNGRIIFRHVLPNVVGALIVQATFIFADAILVEASLSFIGAGIPAPTPSWGNMLQEARGGIYTSWWGVVFPGLAIVIAIFAVNLLGDGLRDFFDPHVRFIPRRRLMRVIRRQHQPAITPQLSASQREA